MPHLTLEYTTNLPDEPDFTALFRRMHTILNDVGGIRTQNCKSRAIALDRFHVADGAGDAAFVHLTVRFLEGRTSDTRKKIGNELLELLRLSYLSASDRLDVQITVEVGEIDREMYFKYPAGSLEY